MPSKEIKFYLDTSRYCSNNFTTYNIDIDIKDLERHAITLGNFSGHQVTELGTNFYRSFIHMMTKNNLTLRDDFLKSEPSLKAAYSFLMGSIITKEVAEKHYGISNLLHLDDNILDYDLISGNKHPDFWGFSKSFYVPYLFEAKGRTKKLGMSTNSPKKNPEIENVKEQLLNVARVEIKNTNVIYRNNQMNKHIIQTVFKKNRSMDIYDIDPPAEGINKNESKDILEIDIVKALKKYYTNIFYILKNDTDGELSKEKIDNSNFFHLRNYKNYSIGISDYHLKYLEELYSIKEDSNDIEEDKLIEYLSIIGWGDSHKFKQFKLAKNIPENAPIGKDGIVFIERI